MILTLGENSYSIERFYISINVSTDNPSQLNNVLTVTLLEDYDIESIVDYMVHDFQGVLSITANNKLYNFEDYNFSSADTSIDGRGETKELRFIKNY